MDVTNASPLTERSDAQLVDDARGGDAQSFAELWRRHSRAGRTVARSVTSSIDPDDLVSESFARIYQAIGKGKGPTGAFRPYLFTTIRNTAAAWGRAKRETSLDTLDSFEDPETNEGASLDALDRSLSARAFRSLPTRWQEVLWYTEIEQMSPAEVAPLLGMKANSVAALAYRAREGLREAWIQAHLKSVEDDSDHAFTIARLGSYARGNLGARDTSKVEGHLDECARCTIVAAEAKEVGSRMALVLLPLVAGTAGALGYTAWLQTGAQSAAVAMAMPLGVTSGAIAGGAVGASQLGGSAAGLHGAGAAHGGAASMGVGAGAGGAGGGSAGGGAGTGGGAGAGGAGAGGGAAAGAGAAAGGVAAAGLSGGIIAAIVVGVIAVGTAAALVVGPMVFPQAPPADTTTVADPPTDDSATTTPKTAPIAPKPVQPAIPPVTEPPAPVEPSSPRVSPVDDTRPATPPNPAVPPVTPPVTPPTTTPTTPPVLPPAALGQPDINTGDGYVWPILSGAGALHGATVTVLDQNGATVATTTADDAGVWSVTVTGLPAGDVALSVTQTDPKTTLSSSPSPRIGTVVVAPPTLSGVSEGDVILAGSTRNLTFTGDPDRSVRLTSNGNVVGVYTLNASGAYALTVTFPGARPRHLVLEYIEGDRVGPADAVNVDVVDRLPGADSFPGSLPESLPDEN